MPLCRTVTSALSSAGGVTSYAGPISLTGDATINSNSSNTTDQLILLGGVNTAAHALTFNGPGGTTVPSSITGGGSIINTGGTLTLAGDNSFGGGVTVNANFSGSTVVVASNTALGTGTVTLAGGNLNFTQGSAIGLNVASNASPPSSNPPPAGYTVNSLAASQIAGVIPAYNWNNLDVIKNSSNATAHWQPGSGGRKYSGRKHPFALCPYRQHGQFVRGIGHRMVRRQWLFDHGIPERIISDAVELAEHRCLFAGKHYVQ